MKCVAKKNCLVRLSNGRLRPFDKNAVFDFDECPPQFRPLVGEMADAPELNFLTAGEQELMEAKWTFQDAYNAIKVAYGKELKKEEGTKKSEVVAQILDHRFRAFDQQRLDNPIPPTE